MLCRSAAQAIHMTARSVDPNDVPQLSFFAETASIFVNGLISALATAVLFLTAIRLGAPRHGALFAAGVLALATPFFGWSTALATPFFGWSTAFFAHSVSGSLLLFVGAAIAFAFAGKAGQSGPPSLLFGLGLGMLLGYTRPCLAL
jgi:hypothetical protein